MASYAAWKNEKECNQLIALAVESRLMSSPANRRLVTTVQQVLRTDVDMGTYLYNMTSVPTRLATPVFATTTEIKSTTLAVVRLKRTKVNRNFQKAGTVGTRPTSPLVKASQQR